MITSRSILTALLPHSVYMVHSWMTHGLQGRLHSRSTVVARTICNSINRVVIQQRLFVEFSYDPHIDSLLRALLACVIIGLYVQWLLQHLEDILHYVPSINNIAQILSKDHNFVHFTDFTQLPWHNSLSSTIVQLAFANTQCSR